MKIFSADYDRLSQEMESEFIALGKRLFNILKQSQAISKRAAQVSSRISGFELNKAENSLKLFQNKIGSMSAGLKHRSSMLSGILGAFREVDGYRESLRQSAESLYHICSAANAVEIYNQQVRDADDKCVHDLKDMGSEICKKSDEFGSRISEISEEIRERVMGALQKEQHRTQQANIILEQIFSGIEPLRDKHRVSADILHHFSIRYRAIFKNIGDMVECLQFHDITRQRIQHSCSAIKEIESRLINPGVAAGSHRIENAIAIGQVQVIQLYQAKAGLEYAARTISSNLKNLSFDIHEIITAAKNLGELTGRHSDLFLDNIERNLSSLQIATKDFLNEKKESAAFPAAVSRNMQALSLLIRDIVENENSIKIAIIGASGDEKISNTGESSSGCLTMEVQDQVTKMGNRIDRISEGMHSIASSICELNRIMEEHSGPPLAEMEVLDSEFEVMIQQFQSTNNYAEGALAEVEILSAALLEDVIEASRLFKQPEVLLQEIEKVCLRLESHIQEAKFHVPHEQLWESGRNRRNTVSSDTTNEKGNVFISDDELSETFLNDASWDHATEISDKEKGGAMGSNPFGSNIELF